MVYLCITSADQRQRNNGIHIVEPLTERGMLLYFERRRWTSVHRLDRFVKHAEYEPVDIAEREFDALYAMLPKGRKRACLSRVGKQKDFNPQDTPQLQELVQQAMG